MGFQGETVIDLGSGGGFDVFLASKKVGDTGKAIGVDMNKVGDAFPSYVRFVTLPPLLSNLM